MTQSAINNSNFTNNSANNFIICYHGSQFRFKNILIGYFSFKSFYNHS